MGVEAVHYALPSDAEPGLGTLWRTCPVTGLDLPAAASQEAWFSKYSSIGTFKSPTSMGVDFSGPSLSSVGWWLLFRCDPEQVSKLILDLAFRLDVGGPDGDLNARLASLVADRWKVGIGLFCSAADGEIWLNPRCLRWIVREMAAALAATRGGANVSITIGAESVLILNEYFRHTLLGSEPDYADVLMACWMLHEEFHGTNDPAVFEPLGALTALGFSMAGRLRLIERYAAWSAIWAVPDSHRYGSTQGWNGFPPSALRQSFKSLTGIEVETWLSASFKVAIQRWGVATDDSMLMPAFDRRSLRSGLGDDHVAVDRFADLMMRELGSTFASLGADVLAETPTYVGLGSTPQTEASPLHDRPLVEFTDGTWSIASADAFARRAVTVPRSVVTNGGQLSDRRGIGGVLGRMFEAHGWDVLARLAGAHTVVTGDVIDASMQSGSRGDAIVAKGDAAIVVEFGLQTTGDAAARGHRDEVVELLKRYAAKRRQATATPTELLRRVVPSIAPLRVGHVVVADDPIAVSAAHAPSLRDVTTDLPDLFIISIDELEYLTDLAEAPISAPDSILAWQAGPRKAPFVYHLNELERLVPRPLTRLNSSLHRLFDHADLGHSGNSAA